MKNCRKGLGVPDSARGQTWGGSIGSGTWVVKLAGDNLERDYWLSNSYKINGRSRISLGVIYMGGFLLQPSLPEADAVNFAPRVKTPVLMLNGRFDYFLPTASSQEPLFKFLGTPAEHKRRIVYEAAHNIPRNEMMKEVVNWMEKYWGPPTLNTGR